MLSQRARRKLAKRYKELAAKEEKGSDMWCMYTWLFNKYKDKKKS